MQRFLIRAAQGLGLIVLLAVAGLLTTIWLSLPGLDGTAGLAGLDKRLEVLRDDRGVPHIFATTALDAYRALGYVHAQDRLFQMEMMRRAGAGRLAEVLGARALASDKWMRTLGLYHLAERQYGRLTPATRAVLDAYAAGVNGWLSGHWQPLPPEFLVLGLLHLEPWRAADSLVWGKLMGMRLAGDWRHELARQALGPARAKAFLDIPGMAPGDPLGAASNGWAVSGKLAVRDKPLLANDPHLRFGVPVLWYLAALRAPGLELTGATAPGTPFIVMGHNGRLAWGMTSAQVDAQDLFVESIDPENSGNYLAPGGPLPFVTRGETIKVKGAPDVLLTVKHTRHGPVVSDFAPEWAPRQPGRLLALQATYLRDGDLTPDAVLGLNRAADRGGAAAALADFHAPVQNIILADTAGAIGLMSVGKVPERGGIDGRLPRPGTDAAADWRGFVAYRRMPRQFDPASGMVVNANEPVPPNPGDAALPGRFAPGYRARRLRDLLAADGKKSAAAFGAMQMDELSMMARQLLPLMTAIEPADDTTRKVVRLLRGWNATMSRRRPEPLIFTAWLRAFNKALYADELGPLFGYFFGLRPRFVAYALTQAPEWCDDVTTETKETCALLLARTLNETLVELSKVHGPGYIRWRWGDAHMARFEHPLFAGLDVVGGWTELSTPVGGGPYTLNRGVMRIGGARTPFAAVHGAGFRGVYDLADLVSSRFMIATGQSGHPFSRHYGDLLEDWRNGRSLRIGVKHRELIQRGADQLILEPE